MYGTCGFDYICLNFKSVDIQINTHLSPETDETFIQSGTLTQTALNPPQTNSKSKRKAMNRNWYNQKANPALNTKAGNK